MPAQITGAFGRLIAAVREFTIAQRTLSLIGLAVIALGAFALFAFVSRPTYTPLYSGLAAEDANAIVEQLRGEGVTYELTEGGSTILVPEEFVYDQRLKAAAAGLPAEAGSGGYALLDDMGVTSSEFQQDVTYKRALEGEIASTVGAMVGIQNASVRLAIPEDTVFVDEQAAPTASVFIETDRGVTLSSDQVQAIVHLTSASIEGMAPTDVAVIDSQGKVLSAVGVGATGGADQQASDYETRTAGQVQTMLDRVLGPGNATVAVTADMNYQSGERLEETFSAPEDGALALNEATSTEEYASEGGGGAGVLGPDNIAVPEGEGGTGSYNAEDTTRNNALNKVTESTIIPAGDINRQTVSVALDVEAAGGLDRQALTDLVATAAGVDPDRGDVVTVEVLPFNNAGAEEAAAALEAAAAATLAEQEAQTLRTMVVAAAALAAVLLVVITGAISRRRRRKREQVELLELEAINAAEAEAKVIDVAPVLPSLPEREPLDLDRKRAEIDALAATDPAKTANYLRSMMEPA